MQEHAKPSLSDEQKADFNSGAISVLIEWLPRLIPGIDRAFQRVGDVIRYDSRALGHPEGYRLMVPSDLTEIRARIESRSMSIYGYRFKTDRVSLAEYADLMASRHPVDGSAWFGELPTWDGTDRLSTIASRLGFASVRSDSETENARILKAVGRVLTMQPAYHARNIPAPVPLILAIDAIPSVLRTVLEPLARGPLRASTTPVRTAQAFVESFDPFVSHLILPGVLQIVGAPYEAYRDRFASIVEQSSAYYRPPNMGLSRGTSTLMPCMVGTADPSHFDEIARYVDVIPVKLGDSETVNPSEIDQCYAQATEFALAGQPVVPPILNVKTNYRKVRKGATA